MYGTLNVVPTNDDREQNKILSINSLPIVLNIHDFLYSTIVRLTITTLFYTLQTNMVRKHEV